MGLLNPYMVKTGLGLEADVSLELEADTGESFRVIDIHVDGSNDTFVEAFIDKVSVGFFRVNKAGGNHLPFPYGRASHSHGMEYETDSTDKVIGTMTAYDEKGNTNVDFVGKQGLAKKTANRLFKESRSVGAMKTVLKYLLDKGIWHGYPVGEGQKFMMKPFTSGKKLGNVMIEYERYDSGDMTKEMPNGSEATEYVFLNYADAGANITDKGDVHIKKISNPEIYPGFPYGEMVPAKTEVDLHGILASEAIDWDAANDYTQTKYLKMIRGREVLFDEDRNGLLFYGIVPEDVVVGTFLAEGLSMIGNYSVKDRREPFMFEPAKTFVAGEELTVYVTFGEGSAGKGEIPREYTEMCLIETVKIVT